MTSSTSSSDRPPDAPAPDADHGIRGLPAVVAAVLPALVLGGWWASCQAPVEDRPLSKAAAEMEARLDAVGSPRVVVIGNSAAEYAVDAERLGERLGTPGEVAKIYVPGSRSPAWYALLDNRVYARDLRPDLVVVPATLQHMLDTEMHEQRRRRLRDHLDGDDPVIEAEVFGTAPWRDVLDRSRDAAQAVFDVPKQLAVGLLFGPEPAAPPDETMLARGERLADAATAEVLALDATDEDALDASIMPVADIEVKGLDRSRTEPMSPEQSLIEEIATLALEHDAQIVFARLPLPDANPAPRAGPALEAETLERLNDLGAGWVDLYRLPVPPTEFFDNIHMTDGGKARVTDALADGLLALGVLGDAPLPPAVLPLRPTSVQRTGTPTPPPAVRSVTALQGCQWRAQLPELEGIDNPSVFRSLGLAPASPLRLAVGDRALTPHVIKPEQDCDDTFVHAGSGLFLSPTDGADADLSPDDLVVIWADEATLPARSGPQDLDLWWVYPGTTLTAAFDTPWTTERGEPLVRVRGVGFGESPRAILSVDGEAVPLQAVGERLEARATLPLDTPSWSVQVAVPADAPLPVLVTDLSLGDLAHQIPVIGQGIEPERARVFGSGRRQRVSRATDPAVPDLGLPRPHAVDGDRSTHPLAAFAVGDLGDLSDSSIHQRTRIGGCWRFVVTEDGTPLTFAKTAGALLGDTPGQYRGIGKQLMFSATDGSDPTTNGRTYAATVRPERACHNALWVYPGDEVVVTAPLTTELLAGATTLELAATSFVRDPGDASLDLSLVVDGTPVLSRPLPLAALQTGAAVALDTPIPPGPDALRLVLSTPPDAPWLLVSSLGLAERADGATPLEPVESGPAEPPTPEDPATPTVDGPVTRHDLTTVSRRAPQGLGFQHLDPDPEGSSVAPLTEDGAPALRFTSRRKGASRLCTNDRPAAGPLGITADLALSEVSQDGPAWAGLLLEVNWIDADGAPVPPPDTAPVSPGPRQRVSLQAAPPPGAERGLVCLRFAQATGQATLYGLEVVGPAPP